MYIDHRYYNRSSLYLVKVVLSCEVTGRDSIPSFLLIQLTKYRTSSDLEISIGRRVPWNQTELHSLPTIGFSTCLRSRDDYRPPDTTRRDWFRHSN